MKRNTKSIIGLIIAAFLAVILANPSWLPFSDSMLESMNEVRSAHFMIGRSGAVTLSRIWTLALAVCILWAVYTIIKLILNKVGEKDDRSQMIALMINSVVKYLIVIIGGIWGLSILGVNTTAVLAGVGIVGLILGFASQSLIEDIITGAFIIFEGQYAIGDIIILDDFRGVVKSIGVRTTTIEDAGGNLKVVNNSDIRNFQNRSKNNSVAICEVSVAYGTNMQRLEVVLKNGLQRMQEMHPELYLRAPRYLGVTELGDSGIGLKIVADVKEEDVFAASRQLNRDVYVLFSESGIEIPFPQVVVHQGK